MVNNLQIIVGPLAERPYEDCLDELRREGRLS